MGFYGGNAQSATVTISDTIGSTFNATSCIIDKNGYFAASFVLPNIVSTTTDIITVSVSAPTFSSSSSGIYLQVIPYVPLAISISPISVTVNVGQSQLFTAAASGGSGTYSSYKWYVGGYVQAGQIASTFSYSPVSAGSYSITVTVTDSLGSTSSQSTVASVTVPPTPTPSPTPNIPTPTPSASPTPTVPPSTVITTPNPPTNTPTNRPPTPTPTQTVTSAPKSTVSAVPIWAFNGAYANYQATYSSFGLSTTLTVKYEVSGVDTSAQSFSLSSTFGGVQSNLNLLGGTSQCSFSKPSPLPVVSQSDLSLLNKGQIPNGLGGIKVTPGVSSKCTCWKFYYLQSGS